MSGPTSAPTTSWSAARSVSSTLVTVPARSRRMARGITLNYKDCLYLTKGNQKVTFKGDDPEHPAKVLHGFCPGPLQL